MKKIIILIFLIFFSNTSQAQLNFVDIAIDYMDVDRDISEWESGNTLNDLSGDSYGVSLGFAPENNESPVVINIKYVSEQTSNSIDSMDTDQFSIELAYGSSGRNGKNVSQAKAGYHYLNQSIPFFDKDLNAHGLYIGYGFGFSISPQFDFAASLDFFAGESGEDEGYITGPKGDVSLIWTLDLEQHYKLRAGYRFRRFGFSEDDTEFGERFIDDISGPFVGFRFAF